MPPPKKALLVVTSRIGDVLLTTPLIRTLRRAWPESQIDALVFEKTEGFLLANPDVNKIITVAEKCSLWSHIKLLFSIVRRYDLAVSIQTGDRPTFYIWVAGKYSIGMIEGSFKYWWWKRILLDRWITFDNINTHTILMNLEVAKLLELDPCHEVVVSWRQDDEKHVATVIPFDLNSEPYAILHVCPKLSLRRWQKDRWVELGRWLEDKGIRVVFTGGSGENEVDYIAQIAGSLSPKVLNMAGKLNLGEVAYLTSKACLYVGVDTATTHMAAALGVPTVAIYGSGNPVKWGPWPMGHKGGNPYVRKGMQISGNVFLIQGIGDCVPCYGKGCAGDKNKPGECLERLPTSIVIDTVQKALTSSFCNAKMADGH